VQIPSSDGIIAIGDVHGCAEELRAMLDRLPLHSASAVVFLGDYIDRGPESRQVVEIVMELASRMHVFALPGNHESCLLEFLADPRSPEAIRFLLNGGTSTLASYCDGPGSYHVPDDHVRFLRSLPLGIETPSHLFVHAGLPEVPIRELDPSQHREEVLWIRTPFLQSTFDWGKTIVHGHTPRPSVEIRARRINVDTGCVYDGKLSAIMLPEVTVFEALAERPVPNPHFADVEGSRRRAFRFPGRAPVLVSYAGLVLPMRTVNVNELGALLEPGDPHTGGLLDIGDRIGGEIRTDGTCAFSFEGRVMRLEQGEGGERYGVQFFAPPVLLGA
jgi:serine/threonine protein phosphatase 1